VNTPRSYVWYIYYRSPLTITDGTTARNLKEILSALHPDWPLNSVQDLKDCDDGILVRILCFWTLSIVLSLSKHTFLFVFQNTTFRRLDSVSVFR
jgi:hypothetical protein